jgi:hypothetical protein
MSMPTNEELPEPEETNEERENEHSSLDDLVIALALVQPRSRCQTAYIKFLTSLRRTYSGSFYMDLDCKCG